MCGVTRLSAELDDGLVLGIDGGGTRSRVRIERADGSVVSMEFGGGVNPNSGSDPYRSLTDVLSRALDKIPEGDRARIRAGVAGVAGFLSGPDAMTQSTVDAWRSVGLPGTPTVCSDLVVGYWSALAQPGVEVPADGVILVAGTGAVAATIRGIAVDRIIDGYGYILGDRGAGAWLGMAVARAALDSATDRGPATVLEGLVLDGVSPHDWIGNFYKQPPNRVAALSMHLDTAQARDDEVAGQIVAQAIDELVQSVHAAAGNDATNIVLTGSIAAGDNPIGNGLREKLRGQGFNLIKGLDGLDGAVELAKRKMTGRWPMN